MREEEHPVKAGVEGVQPLVVRRLYLHTGQQSLPSFLCRPAHGVKRLAGQFPFQRAHRLLFADVGDRQPDIGFMASSARCRPSPSSITVSFSRMGQSNSSTAYIWKYAGSQIEWLLVRT